MEGQNFNEDGVTGQLEIKINNVTNEDGKVLDENVTKTLYQFRELFVHKVILESSNDIDGPFMDGERPIFGPQPLAVPKPETEMWMNTPVKKLRLSNQSIRKP